MPQYTATYHTRDHSTGRWEPRCVLLEARSRTDAKRRARCAAGPDDRLVCVNDGNRTGQSD